MKKIFKRAKANPLLSPSDMPFSAAAVLNPGATEQDGQVVLLLRVEDLAGYSNIHVARSRNGIDGWQIETEPILRYGTEGHMYERWGCEDARVTWLAEEKRWYITYTAYSPMGAAVALARSDDLATVERMGLIFSPNNKDAALSQTFCSSQCNVTVRTSTCVDITASDRFFRSTVSLFPRGPQFTSARCTCPSWAAAPLQPGGRRPGRSTLSVRPCCR